MNKQNLLKPADFPPKGKMLDAFAVSAMSRGDGFVPSEGEPGSTEPALLESVLGALRANKDATKAGDLARKSLAKAAELMFKAGWSKALAGTSRHECMWDCIVSAKQKDVELVGLVQAAVEAGLRPWRDRGSWRHAPIGCAMYFGRHEVAKALARAMDESEVSKAAKSCDGLIFDLLDVWGKSEPIAKDLIEIWRAKGHSVDARQFGRDAESTALMKACEHSDLYPGAARVLLELGADPKLVDGKGRSALHGFCGQNFITVDSTQRARDLIALLIKAGADPLAKDALGMTPIDLARSKQEHAVVEMLAPFEAAKEISVELDAAKVEFASAVSKLRARGYLVAKPDGELISWEQALKEASMDDPKRRKPGL